MMSLAKERQQTHEPVAPAERVRRMSVCLQDLRRASRDWRTSDQEYRTADREYLPMNGHGSERRKSVLDLIGNIDEGFTVLSW